MMVSWQRVAAIGSLLIVLVAVVACEATVSRPIFKDLTYGHLPQLQFDVARVEVVEEYRSPLTEPNVEHLFPTTLTGAIKQWSNDRVRAVGQSGAVLVKIQDASAILEPLTANEDVEGLFTTEQAEEVRAHVVVTVEIVDDQGTSRGFATAEATRTRTIPEDVSLNERDEIYFQMTVALMNDFNASQEQAIRQYLSAYLR